MLIVLCYEQRTKPQKSCSEFVKEEVLTGPGDLGGMHKLNSIVLTTTPSFL